MYSLQCTVYSLQCTVYNKQFTIYHHNYIIFISSVQFIVNSLQFTIIVILYLSVVSGPSNNSLSIECQKKVDGGVGEGLVAKNNFGSDQVCDIVIRRIYLYMS